MGSNFLEADGDDTELQMAVVGIGRTGVVVKTNVVALMHKLEGGRVFSSARWGPCGPVQMEAMARGRSSLSPRLEA